MTARLPLPLHFTMAQDQTSLPVRQPRLGVPKIRPIDARAAVERLVSAGANMGLGFIRTSGVSRAFTKGL